jgi:predicted TIM-barrel fold metal-dependent hydrolase
MNPIPIFDSLTHPTLNGQWILPKWPNCASIDELHSQMSASNVCGAFAVGMEGIGCYNEDSFISLIKKEGNGKLFPIAFFSFDKNTEEEYFCRLKEIKSKGFIGIKLHPRIGKFTLDNSSLPYVIDKANELGLVVMLCTYFYSNELSMLANSVERLGDMLMRVDGQSKVILLHGGVVRILDMMELVRSFPNTLLDLSLTLCKYAGSSIDMDIQFLFNSFDRRVCIGSDHPEIKLSQVRERFNHFAMNTTKDKAENIAYKNIMSFTGIKL